MAARYIWRQLSPMQRKELLSWRASRQQPWHSPPHRPSFSDVNLHISAACYEHAGHIGFSKQRMDSFSTALLETFRDSDVVVHAWCVLPNHYHALIQTEDSLELFRELGRFHGRTSHAWNGEESLRGRQVFCRAADRFIRSDRHFHATVNYIHNNPVHHGYVKLWTEWPWTSAHAYLEKGGRDEAERVWRSYPVKEFGAKWDPPDM